jgi:hypothetical protein
MRMLQQHFSRQEGSKSSKQARKDTQHICEQEWLTHMQRMSLALRRVQAIAKDTTVCADRMWYAPSPSGSRNARNIDAARAR